jgi:riboflavin kinase
MDSELWFALFQLFNMGGHKRQILLGTDDFGRMIGTSQQTASRRLLELVKEGYVTRELTPKGQNIAITEKGLAALKDVYHALKIGLEEGAHVIFVNGVVFSGFGEGAYYVTKSGYKEQFEGRLGFKPYPGTLNLRLRSMADIKARKELEALPGIVIKGFMNGERSYGDVKSFKVLVNEKADGFIVMIHRTHYGQDVLEVVAEESLRKKLRLKDGDLVQLKVLLD